jgi:hypothetical protein
VIPVSGLILNSSDELELCSFTSHNVILAKELDGRQLISTALLLIAGIGNNNNSFLTNN